MKCHCAIVPLGEIHGNPGKFYGDLNGKIYAQTMGTPMGNWVFFNGALEKSLTSEFRINLR